MYGGVSLAIYINGVSQELFRAVQGEGIYKLLKLCFDTDIVVDIISGTSAGGINGLMLGYALANNSDFSLTKDLWRESGDIGKLLYGADANPDTTRSLLDSDNFYREQLAQAFANLDSKRFAGKDCEPSAMNEMDVFLTGTAFEAKRSTTFDDAGRPIDMLDFRQVFRLKYRPERSNPGPFRPAKEDKPARFQALAKLSRITSCFPGAFLPVHVQIAKDHTLLAADSLHAPKMFQYEPAVDSLLCSWGKLESSTYFLDGGLLNNKPFTPTIDAIFTRTADRPVSRILFYVEPDPESTPDEQGDSEVPTFVTAVRKGVLGISTYQSITDDAKLLEEHNSQVVRHVEVCSSLRGKLGDLSEGVGIPKSLPSPHCDLYRGARNNQLVTMMLRGALRDSKTGTEQQMTSASRRAQVKRLFEGLNHERESSELSFDETFRRYDIFFRQRRLHHTVKWLFDEISGKTCSSDDGAWSEEEIKAGRWLLAGLNRNVQFLEILQYWYEDAISKVEVPLQEPDPDADLLGAAATTTAAHEFFPLFRRVSNSLRSILAFPDGTESWLPTSNAWEKDWLNASELDGLNAEMGRRSKLKIDRDAPVPVGDWNGMLQVTDALDDIVILARTTGSKLAALAAAEYKHYVSLDAVVFPLDYLSNLQSFDEVRLLRISPSPTLNEQGVGCVGFQPGFDAEDKLAGRLLGHFSAFLKRSWRSNDILWGRLDAIRHIVLAVVTAERIRELRGNPELCCEVLGRLQAAGLEQLIAGIFPQSPSASHAAIATFFTEMLGPATFVLTPDRLLQVQDLLTQMGQLEAIAEDLPTVLQDAAEQQNEWNRYATAQGGQAKGEKGATFTSPPGYMDPAVIGLKIQNEISTFKTSWKPLADTVKSPRETVLGTYFEEKYRVAQEKLEKGIPPLVLAEYVTRVLLVMNACILASLPPAAREKISGMGLYKRGVRLPLLVGHRMVRLWRGSPSITVFTLSVVLVSSVIALALEVFLFWMHPSLPTEVILFVVVLAIGATCAFLFAKRRRFGL